MMNFDTAFTTLLKHEGGFSDHPSDSGGQTCYGITEAVAREAGYRGDMRELPIDLAKRIYKGRYWGAVRADELPEAVRYAVFDAAVNSGPRQAIPRLSPGCRRLEIAGLIGEGRAAEVLG